MKIIMITYPAKPKQLKQFIYKILNLKLAVCINKINYVKSYYIWEGKIKSDNEKILILKTSDEKVGGLNDFIEKNHPYKIPEILILDPQDVNNSYLDWINN